MDNVITFRPRATVAPVPALPSPAETRRVIEEAAQAALDTADSLLAILDRMEGDTDAEDGADAEPALAAPENYRNRVVWLRNNDSCEETEAPETMLTVVVAECPALPFAALPWRGSGNVVAAAGVALLEMVAGR